MFRFGKLQITNSFELDSVANFQKQNQIVMNVEHTIHKGAKWKLKT